MYENENVNLVCYYNIHFLLNIKFVSIGVVTVFCTIIPLLLLFYVLQFLRYVKIGKLSLPLHDNCEKQSSLRNMSFRQNRFVLML